MRTRVLDSCGLDRKKAKLGRLTHPFFRLSRLLLAAPHLGVVPACLPGAQGRFGNIKTNAPPRLAVAGVTLAPTAAASARLQEGGRRGVDG